MVKFYSHLMNFSPHLFAALIWLACLWPAAHSLAEAEDPVDDSAPIAKVREEAPKAQRRKYVRPKLSPVKLNRKPATDAKGKDAAATTPSPTPPPIVQDDKKVATGPGNDVREVLFAKEYVLLSEIDPIPEEVIAWDKTSTKFLYIPTEGSPYVYFMGRLGENLELNINDEWVTAGKGRRFEQKVFVNLEPTTINLKVFRPDRSFQQYRMSVVWTKLPPAVRARVREGEQVFEKQSGFLPTFKRSAHLQLYAADKMTNIIDLDSQKHAQLTFRVFLPPETEETYDSWRLVVKDEDNKVIGEIKRYGNPPVYVDFREVSQDLTDNQSYSYSITLYKDDRMLVGPENHFSTVEGKSVLMHNYLPRFSVEPREEFGYYQFDDNTGFSRSNFYVGADMTIAFFNRFFVRGTMQLSLHSLDPYNYFTFTRLGFGARFHGTRDRGVFGSPHFFRLDAMVSVGGHTVYDGAPVLRYTQMGILVEPQIVAWGCHYITPSFEVAFRPNFDQIRIAFGITYNFYIRPWNARLGIGMGYDNLIYASSNDNGRFRLVRGFASFAFTL
jgi:hypothetical protein